MKNKKTNLVLIFGVISGLFALIIHLLFSFAAPDKLFEAKWSAGEILTYSSTVSLGLLAVWQNKKFKEENDAAQLRTEKLAMRANELSVISSIIDHESKKINHLKTLREELTHTCDLSELIYELEKISLENISLEGMEKLKVFSRGKANTQYGKIEALVIELISELATYSEKSAGKLIEEITYYKDCAFKVIKSLSTFAPLDELYKNKMEAEDKLLADISEFILYREELLRKVIYESENLEQIKAMYNKCSMN